MCFYFQLSNEYTLIAIWRDGRCEDYSPHFGGRIKARRVHLAYSTDSAGGGVTNISERRTPLSHLLGRCEPPRRVTLHRGGGGRSADRPLWLAALAQRRCLLG